MKFIFFSPFLKGSRLIKKIAIFPKSYLRIQAQIILNFGPIFDLLG